MSKKYWSSVTERPPDPALSCTAGGWPLHSGQGRTYRRRLQDPSQAESTKNGEKWNPRADSWAVPLDSRSESPASISDRRPEESPAWQRESLDVWGSPTEGDSCPGTCGNPTSVSTDLIHRNTLNYRQLAKRSPEIEERLKWQVPRQRGRKSKLKGKTMHNIEENKIKTI